MTWFDAEREVSRRKAEAWEQARNYLPDDGERQQRRSLWQRLAAGVNELFSRGAHGRQGDELRRPKSADSSLEGL